MDLDKDIEILKNKKLVILYSVGDDWGSQDLIVAQEDVDNLIKEMEKHGVKVGQLMVKAPIGNVFESYDPKTTVFLNWCEGLGTDGYDYSSIPRELDRLGFVYTGCDPECLENTTNKTTAKECLLANNLSTPITRIYHPEDGNGWSTFPALVKPARQHCSYGIDRDSVVDNSEQLHKRIDQMFAEYGPEVMVEDFIDGNEYNVAVWGNGDEMEVMPIGMIDYAGFSDYHERLCGFNSKWAENSREWNLTTVACPAPLTPELKKRIDDLALGTFKALGLRDYGRVDIRVRGETPYVLDVNSNPDISADAGFARSASKLDYDFGGMAIHLMGIAAKRGFKGV